MMTTLHASVLRRLAVALLLVGVLGAGSASAQILPSLGGDRAGTSGYQFLKIPVDARSAALGETVVATTRDASALFWNPALASQTSGLQIGLYQASYFVDVQLALAAASYSFDAAGITLGASLQALDSGEMDVTTEFQPFGTGETFSLSNLAAGLTLSQRLTDLFSYGITAKYVSERTAGVSNETYVFDLGIFYRIGGTGASMAVAVRNFGLDGRPEGTIARTVVDAVPTVEETEFERMTVPTQFLLGFAYELFQDRPNSKLTVSAQLNNPNDNAETWNAGVEYVWQNILSLRTGYRLGFEEARTPSFGVGIDVPGLRQAIRFDYGFNHFERLGNAHRFGLNLAL